MQVTGTIKSIGEVQTFGTNGFRKRELILTTNEQYPQSLMIEFIQDRCELLNNYTPGQQVTISINLRGREWVNPEGVTKYFNSIHGWYIQEAVSVQPQQPTPNQVDTPPPFQTTKSDSKENTQMEEQEDDLPF